MVNADLVAKMKPGIILVNTARGDLVDNLAVRQGLLDGRIGGIAMDTLAPNPPPPTTPWWIYPWRSQTGPFTPPIWAATPAAPSAGRIAICGTM